MEDKNKVNMDENYFKMQLKEYFKLYTFKQKNVHIFFNLLANYVGSSLTVNLN